jgi:Zn-dependent protease
VFAERSIQLARIAGIRVGASPSWFLVLGVAIYVLSRSFQDTLGGSQTEAFIVAVAAALLFFLSIVLHEFGHAFAARRSGMKVWASNLWFFGGLAKLDRDSRTPGEEFKVAVAGPVVTLLIVGLCFGPDRAHHGAQGAVDVATLVDGSTSSALELLIGFVGR